MVFGEIASEMVAGEEADEEELVLLEVRLDDEADDIDDVLLDAALLTLLDVLLDDADDIDDMLPDDELLETLLVLDSEDRDEALDALLDEVFDDFDEVANELLTLPLPAALDELLATVPPVQPLAASTLNSRQNNITDLFIMAITNSAQPFQNTLKRIFHNWHQGSTYRQMPERQLPATTT
jgi:hypothetical protein